VEEAEAELVDLVLKAWVQAVAVQGAVSVVAEVIFKVKQPAVR
jgi:hypothetical protein